MAELKITKNNFENEVLKSDIPVLIDFWAAWCGPCRMMSPVIAELAEKYEGKGGFVGTVTDVNDGYLTVQVTEGEKAGQETRIQLEFIVKHPDVYHFED